MNVDCLTNTSATLAPHHTITQAGGDNNNTTESTMDSASNGTSCVSKLLSPIKALAEFVSMVFCKILSCIFCLSSEDKSLKEQKATLEGLREKLDITARVVANDKGEKAIYQAAVQALAPEQRAGILAKLIDRISQNTHFAHASFQPRREGMATRALDELKDVTVRAIPGETFGRVAFAAVVNVRGAIDEMIQALDTKLKA